MEKDRIDIIFDLLDERGMSHDKLDITTINGLIKMFADARIAQERFYGWREGCTTLKVEKELRWLKSEMFAKDVEVVYR